MQFIFEPTFYFIHIFFSHCIIFLTSLIGKVRARRRKTRKLFKIRQNSTVFDGREAFFGIIKSMQNVLEYARAKIPHTRFSESNFTSTQRKLLFLNLLSVTFNSTEKASSINNSRLLVRIWTLRHTSRFLQPGDQPRTLQKVAKMHWTCWIQ